MMSKGTRRDDIAREWDGIGWGGGSEEEMGAVEGKDKV